MIDSCKVCGARNKPCKHYQGLYNTGEKEMNEMTIKEFNALPLAGSGAVVNKLYRALGVADNPDPQSSCVKRGAHVYALLCLRREVGVTDPKVQMGLEEFILVDDECENEGPPDEASLPADRRYWARNRVVMKSIRQALLSFLFESDSKENRQTIGRLCTVRIQEDYPDCTIVLEHTEEDILNKRYRFTLTEGTNTVHYGADFTTDKSAVCAGLSVTALRDVRVDITGEENG